MWYWRTLKMLGRELGEVFTQFGIWLSTPFKRAWWWLNGRTTLAYKLSREIKHVDAWVAAWTIKCDRCQAANGAPHRPCYLAIIECWCECSREVTK